MTGWSRLKFNSEDQIILNLAKSKKYKDVYEISKKSGVPVEKVRSILKKNKLDGEIKGVYYNQFITQDKEKEILDHYWDGSQPSAFEISKRINFSGVSVGKIIRKHGLLPWKFQSKDPNNIKKVLDCCFSLGHSHVPDIAKNTGLTPMIVKTILKNNNLLGS